MRGKHLHKLFGAVLHWKFDFLPNFISIPVFILVWIYNIYFTLWVTIQYYFILMLELYHLSLVPLCTYPWFLWLTYHCELFFHSFSHFCFIFWDFFLTFFFFFNHSSVQFSSVALSCPTLCSPMDHSTPRLHVQRQLLEFTQTHVHWVGDAI